MRFFEGFGSGWRPGDRAGNGTGTCNRFRRQRVHAVAASPHPSLPPAGKGQNRSAAADQTTHAQSAWSVAYLRQRTPPAQAIGVTGNGGSNHDFAKRNSGTSQTAHTTSAGNGGQAMGPVHDFAKRNSGTSHTAHTTGAGNGGQITISRRETRALTPIAGMLGAAFADSQPASHGLSKACRPSAKQPPAPVQPAPAAIEKIAFGRFSCACACVCRQAGSRTGHGALAVWKKKKKKRGISQAGIESSQKFPVPFPVPVPVLIF